MFHPVGPLPPSVYWRRRLVLLGAAVVLIILTAWVLRPGNSGGGQASPQVGHTSSANAALTSSAPLSTPTPRTSSSTPHIPAGSATRTGPSAPTACSATQLSVAAVPASTHYKVGDEPQLMLQVTNKGPGPCVQDLSDSQVELRVYNGESRVWGSHDCEIQPGTADRTLAVGQPVRVSIVWSGLSSEPKCAGTRQRVGAGTYTLFAYLSGRTGTAAQFAIS
ncbi:MAG TPA: hypothetical protein VGH01_03825 [Jatrophihabitantaceae bacterium]|jgi:hypothetical protein